MAFIFSLLFGRLADIPSEGVPFPLFALAGLVPWLFVAQSVTQCASSLLADANLISKVYFPRFVIPAAKVLALMLDLLIALAVLVVFVLLYGEQISAMVVFAVPFLALALVVALGIGTLVAALNVEYRDVSLAVPLLVQIWLFLTPVIYPSSLITGDWQYVYALNPMVAVLDGMRWAVVGAPAPSAGVVGVSVASALVLFVVGVLYFRRTERFFADVI